MYSLDMIGRDAPLWAYVGTYAPGESPGIYCGFLHWGTGRLELTGSLGGIPNPSFLAVNSVRRCLYAVSEIGDFQGESSGGIYAYRLDTQTGQPTFLNARPSGGAGPCHLCVDPGGRYVLAANYGGGSVALLPVQNDGRLGAASAIVVHEGAGPDPKRQAQPHAHSVVLAPDNRFALCADLGLDRIFVYTLGAGTLTAHHPPGGAAPGGSGPRHSVFHPNGRYLYTNTEMASEIIVWAYDGARGTLRDLERVSALATGFSGQSAASGIAVHPTGRFLYSANRGPDSIAVFAVDSHTGRLTAQGQISSGGKNPRDITIDPSGRFLLAAHQDSGTVVSFLIDPLHGNLTPTGQTTAVPNAACVAFAARSA